MRARLGLLLLLTACHPLPPPSAPAAVATPTSAPTPTLMPTPVATPTTTLDFDELLALQSRSLYACIEHEAATRPGFGGHLDAEVEVDARGRVVNVKISDSTFPDESALPCLQRAWRDMRVPSPHDHTVGHMRLVWESSASCPQIAQGAHGTMDKEMIRLVIRSHLDEIRACYERKLLTIPTLQGRVMVQFVIDGNGTVAATTVQSSTFNEAEVDSCITGAVRGWHFPQPCGGGIVIVSYPFVLKTSGPGARTNRGGGSSEGTNPGAGVI
jgi:hypothetical protein